MKSLTHIIAFTLVEILIAITIFLTLTGIIASMLTTLNELGEKTVGIVDMHQQAGDIMHRITTDARNLHTSAALSLDFSNQSVPQTTFMANEKKEHGRSGSYGPYSLAPNKSNTDFLWVRYEFDLLNGMINRGHTRPPTSSMTVSSITSSAIHKSSATDTSGINRYQRMPTPQTEMIYFEGKKGNPKVAAANWDWDDDATILASEKRQMYHHCDFLNNTDTEILFHRPQNYKYFIYTHSVVGNSILMPEDAWAVRNQDGLSYNKDRLNLVGSTYKTVNAGKPYLDKEIYPRQLHPLSIHNNIECAIVTYHLANDSLPTDANTLDDNNISIDIKGTGPQCRDINIIANRPDFIHISFLLHNITNDYPDYEDLDGDPTTTLLIDAIRNQVHVKDGTALSITNYETEMAKRQQDMAALIEQEQMLYQIFNFTVKLAK